MTPSVKCEDCQHVRSFQLDNRWHGGLMWCAAKSDMPTAYIVNPKTLRVCAVYAPAYDQSV